MGMIRKYLVGGRADATVCGRLWRPSEGIQPKKRLDVPGRIWQDIGTSSSCDLGSTNDVRLLWAQTLRGGGQSWWEKRT